MADNRSSVLSLLVVLVFQVLWFERGISVKVTYDHKALIIDGKRRILQSGSVHYPRTTPEVSLILVPGIQRFGHFCYSLA